MAMFDSFPMEHSHIRAAFDAVSRDGQRYMMVLQDVGNDPYMVTIWERAQAAASEADIVAYLRLKTNYGFETRLKAVYDTQKTFKSQERGTYKETLLLNLSPATRRQIEADAAFYRAEQQYRQMPWIQRVFTPAPVAPALPVVIARKPPVV